MQRIVGNTLMAFSFPFGTSAGVQQISDGIIALPEALLIGSLPAFAAFVFTAGNELRKRGNDLKD